MSVNNKNFTSASGAIFFFSWKINRVIEVEKNNSEAKAEISVSGTLDKYTYKAGEAILNKSIDYRSSCTLDLFKSRNKEITLIEKWQPVFTLYENYICQYKAPLLQCEWEFDLMINVSLHEIILPFFKIKHGQFAAVALIRSGATKLLKKFGKLLFWKETDLFSENNTSQSILKKGLMHN